MGGASWEWEEHLGGGRNILGVGGASREWEEHLRASEGKLSHSEYPAAARPWTPKAQGQFWPVGLTAGHTHAHTQCLV